MRVIHVAPSVFGPDGLYGGGERYPLELAGPGRRGGLRTGHLRPAAREVAYRRWLARPRPPATDLAARPPGPAGCPAAAYGAHPCRGRPCPSFQERTHTHVGGHGP